MYHILRFRLYGTQTFYICHCRGHFPFNIFPTEEVGTSKPTRTLRCKRFRVFCLHYFLDKDFVQLDPATAAQLILAAERLRSWAPLRYSIFTIYFHSNSNFPAELFNSINLCFLLLTTTLVIVVTCVPVRRLDRFTCFFGTHKLLVFLSADWIGSLVSLVYIILSCCSSYRGRALRPWTPTSPRTRTYQCLMETLAHTKNGVNGSAYTIWRWNCRNVQ